MLGGDRAARMGQRLERELKRAGLPEPDRESVLDGYRLAVGLRLARLEGDHPALLHPARTVIVLLEDVGPLAPETLAAASLVESEEPALRVDEARIEDELGARIATLAHTVPPAGHPRLAEALVTSDESIQLVALAERLDQLRHAHLWDDPERLRSAHEEAVDVYLPVAVRVHPVLERRFRWWCETFEVR